MKKIFSIEFTNHCNFWCKFCPHSIYGTIGKSGNAFNRPKGHMSQETFDLVLKNTKLYAKKVLLGFFGEQLLHPQFKEFISVLSEQTNCPIQLNTNWSLVTESHFDYFSNLNTIKISLDSINPATYDILCPGGKVLNLNGVVEKNRCEAIIEKMKIWLKLHHRPSTQIIFVTSSVNKDQIDEFVSYWRPLLRKRDTIAVKSVISYGGVVKDSYMTNSRCNLHKGGKVNISWDGNISPCNLDVNMDLKVANILNENDLGNVFRSKEWKAQLTSIKNKSGICANCFDGNNRKFRRMYTNEA